MEDWLCALCPAGVDCVCVMFVCPAGFEGSWQHERLARVDCLGDACVSCVLQGLTVYVMFVCPVSCRVDCVCDVCVPSVLQGLTVCVMLVCPVSCRD